jgi:crossover junction endodeoxyribonuclease RuvC
MTQILGIDPGAVSGGCAIVELNDGAAPQLIDAIDLPVIGIKAKQRIDVLALRNWIQRHKPDHAYVERGQALPKQGASSGFKYGRGCGAIEAVIQLLEIPMTIVEASVWKRAHHLRGGDKEGARQRALMLFPSAHALLARKKDHGRAEAALIALTPMLSSARNIILPAQRSETDDCFPV